MNQPKVAGYSPAVTVLLAIYPLWFLSNYSFLTTYAIVSVSFVLRSPNYGLMGKGGKRKPDTAH